MMKTYLLNNKFHFIATSLIIILFSFSVFLRQERLNADVIPGEEWISAHVLMTTEIWQDNGGPSNSNFNPIYTYGKGSQKVTSIGGLMDEEGNFYYVSYPPFAFIFSYYGMQLLGGVSVYNLRTLNLILHFFCAYFIYLLIRKISSKSKDHFSVPGVFCAFVYLFSSGTLWIHSVLFFSDILVQFFLIIIIYYLVKLVKKDFKTERKILTTLGVLFFLATYTEWMGLFMAFFSGCTFLIIYILNKKRIYLKTFLVLGISSSFALGLTILQYSSISGMDNLIEVSEKKYDIRSGHQSEDISEGGYGISNVASYEKINDHLNENFLMVLNLLGITGILLIVFLIWRKTRRLMTHLKLKGFVAIILAVPLFCHLFIFFNFNAIHDFATLKFGLFAILLSGLILLSFEQMLPFKLKFLLLIPLLIFGVTGAFQEYKRYLTFYDLEKVNFPKIESAQVIQQTSRIDQMAFTNFSGINPEYMYLAKHTPYITKDTSNLAFLMAIYEIDTAHYYHHIGDTLKYVLHVTWNGKSVTPFKRTDYN